MFSTHMGDSNGLEVRVSVTEAAGNITERFPNKFVFFCDEIPDLKGPTQKMESWLKKGAAGIGELKFNLPSDSSLWCDYSNWPKRTEYQFLFASSTRYISWV
ncbi:MAG TPA: hypothetical protein DCS60_04485 [Opitutae bacterium]|nr:hypothetical protein [Opitutae bacterium]